MLLCPLTSPALLVTAFHECSCSSEAAASVNSWRCCSSSQAQLLVRSCCISQQLASSCLLLFPSAYPELQGSASSHSDHVMPAQLDSCSSQKLLHCCHSFCHHSSHWSHALNILDKLKPVAAEIVWPGLVHQTSPSIGTGFLLIICAACMWRHLQELTVQECSNLAVTEVLK